MVKRDVSQWYQKCCFAISNPLHTRSSMLLTSRGISKPRADSEASLPFSPWESKEWTEALDQLQSYPGTGAPTWNPPSTLSSLLKASSATGQPSNGHHTPWSTLARPHLYTFSNRSRGPSNGVESHVVCETFVWKLQDKIDSLMELFILFP